MQKETREDTFLEVVQIKSASDLQQILAKLQTEYLGRLEVVQFLRSPIPTLSHQTLPAICLYNQASRTRLKHYLHIVGTHKIASNIHYIPYRHISHKSQRP